MFNRQEVTQSTDSCHKHTELVTTKDITTETGEKGSNSDNQQTCSSFPILVKDFPTSASLGLKFCVTVFMYERQGPSHPWDACINNNWCSCGMYMAECFSPDNQKASRYLDRMTAVMSVMWCQWCDVVGLLFLSLHSYSFPKSYISTITLSRLVVLNLGSMEEVLRDSWIDKCIRPISKKKNLCSIYCFIFNEVSLLFTGLKKRPQGEQKFKDHCCRQLSLLTLRDFLLVEIMSRSFHPCPISSRRFFWCSCSS